MDVSTKGAARRVEVVDSASGRRQRTEAEKARIAAESLFPGVAVADIARKHKVTRWQVYDWRRRLKDGRLALPESVAEAPAFAALMIEGPPEPIQATPMTRTGLSFQGRSVGCWRWSLTKLRKSRT